MSTFGKSRVESRSNIQQLLESTRALTQEYKRTLHKRQAGNQMISRDPVSTKTSQPTSASKSQNFRSNSRSRASPTHTAINSTSIRPEVDISHLTANQSFAAGVSVSGARVVPRHFAWDGSTNAPVSEIKSPRTTLLDESMSVQQTSFQWPSKQALVPVQPSTRGASTLRLGVLTEATSPGAWRSEHDESFALPASHAGYAAIAASAEPAVTGSQADELMDRINHVNRLLAEVEHIYPEAATATTAVATTAAASTAPGTAASRRGDLVTAHEVEEVTEGVPVDEGIAEAEGEKELMNLTQFVTDEITTAVDNALAAVNASYSAPVKVGEIEIVPDDPAKLPNASESLPENVAYQNLNSTFVSEAHGIYRWPVPEGHLGYNAELAKSKFRPGRKLTKPSYMLNRPDPILGILPQEKAKLHNAAFLASESQSQFVWPSRPAGGLGLGRAANGKPDFFNSPAAVCTQADTEDWELVRKEDAIPASEDVELGMRNQTIHPLVNDSFSTLHDVSPTKVKPTRYSYNEFGATTKASLHPTSYAFGSTTPNRKTIPSERATVSGVPATGPASKPVLKASTPVQRQSSTRSPHSSSKRFDPILMNQRYPHMSDNKTKWVSETSRSFSLKAVAPKKRF